MWPLGRRLHWTFPAQQCVPFLSRKQAILDDPPPTHRAVPFALLVSRPVFPLALFRMPFRMLPDLHLIETPLSQAAVLFALIFSRHFFSAVRGASHRGTPGGAPLCHP